MSDMKALKQSIVTYLSQSIIDSDILFTHEFPDKMKPVPLSKCRVSVGFDSLSATTGGLDDFLGDTADTTLYGKQVDIVARFDIVVPERLGGTRCHTIFEQMTGALMITRNDFGVTKMWCDDIAFDKNLGGFVLTCRSNLSALIYNQQPELIFDSFEVKQKRSVNPW